MRHALMRILLFLAGGVCVILGIIGLLLPIMPGWAFFLLAAACFCHGSDRVRERLEAHPWYRFHRKRRDKQEDDAENRKQRRTSNDQ